MDILKSKVFWTLVVGVIAFVVKFYSPTFPMDEVQILAVVLFVLHSFGIDPELRARGIRK